MAKFIIEVDDEFIRKQADKKALIESLNNDDTVSSIIRHVAFTEICEALDKGTTEFHVKVVDLKEPKELEIIEHAIAHTAVLSFIVKKRALN